ncbi:hypothetical protein REPUB_Repub10bG0161700 [Reevesia pubescens]
MMKTCCELDVASYNVRISNFQGDKQEKVKELIDDMSSMGLKLDTISYNYLMNYYCKNRMLDEVTKVYKGLEEGLVMNKKIKEAKGLIRIVVNKFPPNFLNAWKKLEKELGLVSGAGNDEAQ